MAASTSSSLTTLLGAATATYGAAILVRPQLMTSPLELGSTAPTRALTRAVGARDVVSGLAMVLAPAGLPRRAALVARILADAGDAVVFGTSAPGTGPRLKAVGGAGGWGLLNAVALALELREG